MPPVIQVENLSKLYRLGEVSTGTLSHDLNRWWHRVRRKEDPYLKIGQVNDRTRKKSENGKDEKLKGESVSAFQHSSISASASDYVYALKDINFSVNEGEVLGIIGRNGAGKSTLLKILSRVTAPSSGHIKVKGRIASLLEVGTGFNPELTGRENIYLNGSILGMRRREITRKLDDIIDFSGCAAYLDTPVKRYSSGMSIRLAFSVAAFLEAEILVIDEVLAVGDAEFQKSCLGRMHQLRNSGRTVIFVSHQLGLIQNLCEKSICLSKGVLSQSGATRDVIAAYLSEHKPHAIFHRQNLENKPIQITSASITSSLEPNDYVSLVLEIKCCERKRTSIDVRLKDSSMNAVAFGSVGTLNEEKMIRLEPGTHSFSINVPIAKLANGNYLISLDLNSPNVEFFDKVDDCLQFSVDRPPSNGAQRVLQQSWGLGTHELSIELEKSK